jgi:two-component system, NtrC family, sensor kinase
MNGLFRKIPLSLRTEIVLNIAVLMMASLLLVGFTILKVSEEEILEQKKAASRIVLSSIQRGVNAFYGVKWQRDPRFIQILAGFTQGGSVEGAWFVDRDLKPLITQGRGQRDDEALRKAMAEGNRGEHLEKRGILWWTFYERLILTAPLVAGGKIVGGVQVVFSMSDVMDRLLVFRRLFLVLIVVDALVIIVFGSILLSRVVVNPLKRLVRVARDIERGDLRQRAPVDYENEIGTLAKAFNQMVERLTEKQADLQQAIKELRDTRDRQSFGIGTRAHGASVQALERRKAQGWGDPFRHGGENKKRDGEDQPHHQRPITILQTPVSPQREYRCQSPDPRFLECRECARKISEIVC